MDLEEKLGVKYKDVLILIILLGFFYYGIGEVNLNQSLTPTFITISVGLATMISIFYSLIIAKPVKEKLDDLTYSIWLKQLVTIKPILEFINNETKKKVTKVSFKNLENKTEKLFDEVSNARNKIGRYNLKKYLNLSVILFLLSTIIFLINMVHPIPIFYLQSTNGSPIYFSAIGFLLFLFALWYSFKLLFVWYEL